ncbi:MAG: alpha/beta fold hydrolase [Myxococcales bacterium]|nr:alpha/beta fold hydrolase [Myxococcales bacterium]
MTATSPVHLDAYCTSGPSPTVDVHLFGVGHVGRAWLDQLTHHPRLRLVAATDSSATVRAPAGLDPVALAAHKAGGRPLEHWLDEGAVLPAHDRAAPGAQLIVDASPSDLGRAHAHAEQIRAWLDEGRSVVVASKHAALADPDLLAHPRFGANAALGGTGARLQQQLVELRKRWCSVAIAGSASSSAILDAVAQGGTLEQGIAQADAAGLLEPDPEQDLRGVDAAVKLAIVLGALRGSPVPLSEVAGCDLRDLDVRRTRQVHASGQRTRLVATVSPEQPPRLQLQAVPAHDPLAVPIRKAAYVFGLEDGSTRVHVGSGLGPVGTATALWTDVLRLLHRRTQRDAEESTSSHPSGGERLFDSGAREGTPAVVLGGISAGRELDWWPGIVGPGCALDPDHHRLLTLDYLSTDQPVSPRDQADAVVAGLDALGIERVTVVGASYGGMVGLALAAAYPERVDRLLVLAAAHRPHPLATAVRSVQRQILQLPGVPAERAVALARQLAVTTFRRAEELEHRFAGPSWVSDGRVRAPVDSYLAHQGRRFAERFDRRRFASLLSSVDLHWVDPRQITVPVHLVGFTDDALVPEWLLAELADGLCDCQSVDWVRSATGHDGFLTEVAAVGSILRRCLEVA